MKKFLMMFLLLALVTPMIGCKTMRAAAARDRHIYDATARHVYPVDCTSVLQDARALLFERGYSVKTVDSQTMTVETEWLYDSENAGKRFLVQAMEPAADACQIKMMSSIEREGDVTTARDLPVEWELLQRVHPSAASQIQAEADTIYIRMRNE